MSRKRYISTDISKDTIVNKLAEVYGDFAVLLYTWLIPHAEDDACIRGDVEEIMADVIPRMRHKSVVDVEDALAGMNALGLIEWDKPNNVILFPVDSFYKHQKYIKESRRRQSAKVAEIPRSSTNVAEVPGSSAQFLASLTHTHSHTHTHSQQQESGGGEFPTDVQIVNHYAETFGTFLNETQISRLNQFCEDGMSVDVVLRAITAGREAGKDFGYVRGILRRQFDQGIRTLESVQEADRKHQEKMVDYSYHTHTARADPPLPAAYYNDLSQDPDIIKARRRREAALANADGARSSSG